MRVSSYVSGARIPGTNQFVLLHGFGGDLIFVDNELGEEIISRRGNAAEADWIACIASDTRIALADQGFLTELSEGQERDIVVQLSSSLRKRNFSTNPTAFMIVPTVTCNLRCPYCFQSHEMHKGKGVFGNLMTEDQLDVIFAAIDRLGAPGALLAEISGLKVDTREDAPRERQITLFGGEPLCRETLPIIPSIVERCTDRGLTLSAITNGVELDLFHAYLGADTINHLQVTLDGLADKHDRRRIGPQHKKTFDTIVKNVGEVLEMGITIAMRINVDTANLLNIKELNDFFREIGWYAYPNFHPYAAAVDALSPQQKIKRVSHYEVYSETERLREEAESRISSYEGYAEELVTKILLKPDAYPFLKGSTCSAETGQLIFDPLGDIYSCWEDVGVNTLRVATYDAQGLKFETEAITKWFQRFPGNIEQCASCPYALIHTSGCGAHARVESGDLHSSACEGFQELFPPSLGKAVRRFSDSFEDATNRKRAV